MSNDEHVVNGTKKRRIVQPYVWGITLGVSTALDGLIRKNPPHSPGDLHIVTMVTK